MTARPCIRKSVAARCLLAAGLGLTCLLLAPAAGWAANDPQVPTEWPQVALIENKSAGIAEKATTGMPVPDPRQLDYDVLHYSLNLQVDPTWGWLAGTVTVIFRVGSTPLSEFVLDLRNGMTCSSITISQPYQRNNVPFTHADDLLVGQMPYLLSPGAIGMVTVQYWGQPQAEGLFGYQVGTTPAGSPIVATVSEPWSARSWWPCKDEPTDKATVNMTVSAPSGMKAVSNGILVESKPLSRTWSEPLPIPTYLVSLAVSDYVTIEDSYNGPAGPINLRHHVFPADEADAREDLSILPEMLDFCGELFGPYPFVNQPFGIAECVWDEAMEHPTAVTYGDVLITGTHQFDTVLMHELAHMWFGNLITPTDWTHVWLNEGFATYAEALWAENVYGRTGLSNFMAAHDWGHDYGVDSLLRNPDNGYAPYYFRTIAYHKGAWVLHMLRRQLGDEVFFAAIKEYLSRPELRFGNADSADFQQVCEDVSGRPLGWFFDQWLRRTTYPVIRLEWSNNWLEGANEMRVRLRQEQVAEPDGSRPAYKFPIDVRFVGTGLDTTITITSSRLDQDFVFPLPKMVNWISIDPNRWLLYDLVGQKDAQPLGPAGGQTASEVPAPVRLLAAHPNPFNPRTVFAWEAEAPSTDIVEVFDVLGRRLLQVELGEQAVGRREYLWRGVDDSGREQPSGTYLYRITCRGRTADGTFERELHGKVTLAR